jgi:hypothetical protein
MVILGVSMPGRRIDLHAHGLKPPARAAAVRLQEPLINAPVGERILAVCH